jgi:hypothetical protein
MAAVSITVNADSEDIAALVALGSEVSAAVDKWIAVSESAGVAITYAELTFANVSIEED